MKCRYKGWDSWKIDVGGKWAKEFRGSSSSIVLFRYVNSETHLNIPAKETSDTINHFSFLENTLYGHSLTSGGDTSLDSTVDIVERNSKFSCGNLQIGRYL